MYFLLYIPLIGLFTISIIFPTILCCCYKNDENDENNENNENNKLFETDNEINTKNKIKIYDPLLL